MFYWAASSDGYRLDSTHTSLILNLFPVKYFYYRVLRGVVRAATRPQEDTTREDFLTLSLTLFAHGAPRGFSQDEFHIRKIIKRDICMYIEKRIKKTTLSKLL